MLLRRLLLAVAVLCIGAGVLLFATAFSTLEGDGASKGAPALVVLAGADDLVPTGDIAVTPPPVWGESSLLGRIVGWAGDDVSDDAEAADDEKPVTAKVPVTSAQPSPTETAAPTETPTPSFPGAWGTTAPPDEAPATTSTPEVTVTTNTTISLASAATVTSQSDDTDDEEPEETVAPVPTLEREAPPRPGATLAKSHQSHDRPLVQSNHQLITPASAYTPGENTTPAPPAVTVPRDGLLVKGVGVLLDRTPEDMALTRNGVEIANLDWLLDTAMRLGGRHPRAALEGETFTVSVTTEARNVTLTKGDPVYVVLVPPPGETGVYEITRTREPGSLRDGERAVWEFSVVTRTGRLTLANLTLPEERLVTNLTSNPDLFAFRAYAFAGNQEYPSVGLSDPVIAVRRSENADAAAASSLPALYARAGVDNSTLRSSETMTGAWKRGVDHDAIVTEAAGHLGTLQGLRKEELMAIYAEEGKAVHGTGAEASAAPSSPSSPFDAIAGLFRGLFGWFGGTARTDTS